MHSKSLTTQERRAPAPWRHDRVLLGEECLRPRRTPSWVILPDAGSTPTRAPRASAEMHFARPDIRPVSRFQQLTKFFEGNVHEVCPDLFHVDLFPQFDGLPDNLLNFVADLEPPVHAAAPTSRRPRRPWRPAASAGRMSASTAGTLAGTPMTRSSKPSSTATASPAKKSCS